MPVYNSEKCVCEAIESVINQTVSNWELLIIDDGSKDESGIICDYYAANDDRIHVYHRNNSGVSETRNFGLKKAKGDFIEFIDSDDILSPNAIETLVSSISPGIDLVIFGYESFPNRHLDVMEKPYFYNSKEEFAEDYELIQKHHILNPPWNKLYRRQIIYENNICFPKDMSMGEDLCFNLDYLARAQGILVLPGSFYKYRVDNQFSLSSRFRSDTFKTQKFIKEKTDAILGANEKVKAFTSEIFIHYIVEGLKAVVYQDEIIKDEKEKIICEWISDPYFIDVYTRCSNKKNNHFVDYLIRRKKVKSLYYLFSLRRNVSLIIHNHQKMRRT